MTAPLRIAQLSRAASRLDGGIYFALTGLLPALARASTNAAILRAFAAADAHSVEDATKWQPVETETFPTWPSGSFSYAPSLPNALAGFAPEVVHVHGLWNYAALVGHQARRRGIPLVVSPHGMLDAGALRFSPWRKRIAAAWFQRAMLESADVLHALNASEARAIRAYGLRNPIVVLPNGVDLPATTSASPSEDAAEDRPLNLLFIGRLHPKKGLPDLLRAWIPLSARGQPAARWRLVIAGWDEQGHEAELRAQVAAAGAGDRVEFAGPIWGERKTAALRACHGFVLPSTSEGLPISVLEAWAEGRPALVTEACNLPEGVTSGAAVSLGTGPESLVSGLRKFVDLPSGARHAMGVSARRLAEEKFAWPRIAAHLFRAYRAVGRGEPLPGDLLFPPA